MALELYAARRERLGMSYSQFAHREDAARDRRPRRAHQWVVRVTTGTTLGMLASDELAVFLGERIAAKVQMKWMRWGAAALIFAFGAASAWQAIRA